MNRNYQKELETLLEHTVLPKRLLLHSCCAPCSSYVLEYLSRFFEITLFFYNPNMNTADEFERRAEELLRLTREMSFDYPVKSVIVPYEAREFYEAVHGLEHEPEGGLRCEACFRLRLRKAAEYAFLHQFDYFTTTLTISPLKNAALLNGIGEAAGQEYGVPFLPSDFKKKGGFQRSIQLSEQYGLYRQNYCGCVFSER